MGVLPIPFFEAQSRFEKLDLDSLDHEVPEVRAFLRAQHAEARAVESYAIVRFFLLDFVDNGSYNVYRTQIEKLLSGSICIAARPLTALENSDVLDFLSFVRIRPQVGLAPALIEGSFQSRITSVAQLSATVSILIGALLSE